MLHFWLPTLSDVFYNWELNWLFTFLFNWKGAGNLNLNVKHFIKQKIEMIFVSFSIEQSLVYLWNGEFRIGWWIPWTTQQAHPLTLSYSQGDRSAFRVQYAHSVFNGFFLRNQKYTFNNTLYRYILTRPKTWILSDL